MITKGCMRQMRRKIWEEEHSWKDDEEESLLGGDELLPKDLQDYFTPMVIIGNNMVSLYPSLDITKVVENVKKAVLESEIKWQEGDYLEAAHYVALNWTEKQCRSSPLGRILPTRRCTTGCRPGEEITSGKSGPTGHYSHVQIPLCWSQVPTDGRWAFWSTWSLYNCQAHHANI